MAEAATAQAARATIGDSEFDRDTAVTLREPGVYGIDLSAGWTIVNAVNGGYLLAVLGRALGDALPHRDPFTVSAHYLTASRPGPAVIRTDVVRAAAPSPPARRRSSSTTTRATRSNGSASSPRTAIWTPCPTTSVRARSRPPSRHRTGASVPRTVRRRSPAARPSPTGSSSG